MIPPTDYRATFGTASGQRVLEELWSQFWGDSVMFAPGIPPTDLAFREGQRSVVVMLRIAVDESMNDTDNPSEDYREH